MSPADARITVLVAECRRDWSAVELHLARAASVDPAAGPAEAALIALSLDHAYQAFETILVRIERALGLPERSGASWHTSVLVDASLDLPGLRPALHAPEVGREWDALLRFRHFLRHAYVIDLDPGKLRLNRARLQRAVGGTQPGLEALLATLTAPDSP